MAAMICDASESAILIAFLSFPDTTVPTHATLLESNKKTRDTAKHAIPQVLRLSVD